MMAQTDFVTVVSGLPRSGTSMMMRILEKGGLNALTDSIRAADVDNPNGYYEFEPVKRTKADASWLSSALGKSVKMVYALLYDLPCDYPYRVVFMRRNLKEVFDSQDTMLQRHGKPHGKIKHEQLMTETGLQLDRIDAWLRRQPNFKLHYVDYNAMIRDPARGVHALNRFLNGELDVSAMIEVVDPKLYRQRR